MRSLLLFLEVWVSYAALLGAFFAILAWLLSIDSDRKDKLPTSFVFWSILWPIIWLYYRLIGKHSDLDARRASHTRALMGMSETISLEQGMRFRTIREAKDYLAGRIAEEAEREGATLTDVEGKMLYFTETGWTLPDLKQVSAEFDRDYDQDEYEKKIGVLTDRIQSRQQDEESWNRALQKLSQGDHYLLVLVGAENSVQKGLKHNLTALVIAIVFVAYVVLEHWFRQWMWNH
jgi:hypothetical protein